MSPPYTAAIVGVPAWVGVNVTEHDPDTRMHVVELNEPLGPVSENETVPVGVVGPGDVSVIIAVHVEPWFTRTDVGAQLMVVVVEC